MEEEDFIRELRNLIVKGNLAAVVALVQENSEDSSIQPELRIELLGYAAQFSLIQRKWLEGTLTTEEYHSTCSRISRGLLNSINEGPVEAPANKKSGYGKAGHRHSQKDLIDRVRDRKQNWDFLERAAIDGAVFGGLTAMGFYRDAWKAAERISGDEKNPSTNADLQATLTILRTLDSSLQELANKFGCDLLYFGEETSDKVLEKAKLKLPVNLVNHIKEPKEFFSQNKNVLRVIFDAIDGTASFLRGFPLFCSAVAILVDEIPRVSAIYDPVHNVVYSAVLSGSDAAPEDSSSASQWHVPIGQREDLIKKVKSLKDHPLEREPVGIHISRSETNRNKTREFLGVDPQDLTPSGRNYLERLATNSGGIYALNSGVFAMAEVARGSLGGFVNIVTYPWDVAAGEVLIRAIGGKVSSYEDENEGLAYDRPGKVSLISARTKKLHSAIFRALHKS